jgi:phage tail-like protein
MGFARAVGISPSPVLGHNFVVSLLDTSSAKALAKSIIFSAVGDVLIGGFQECSGIEMSLKIEEYREGGRNGEVLVFPTRTEWGNITLRKGVGMLTPLWDWSYSFVEGKGKRRDGLIVLLNDLHVPSNIWYFRRGLPLKYTGPTMHAQENKVAIDTMVIAHEGIYQVPFVGIGAAVSSLVAAPIARAL